MKQYVRSCAFTLRSFSVLRYAPLLRMSGVGLLILAIYTSHIAATVFQAHRAGSWYPADKKELTNLLNQMSNDAQDAFAMQTDHAKIRALIAPHAGYAYSGIIASAVYNLINASTITDIIILGPSHFMPLSGIAVPTFTQYRTPLGTLNVNTSAIRMLNKNPLITRSDAYFKPEHSIEMQLPLIQRSTPKAKITPIIVGHLSDAHIKEVAALLKPLITPTTLVIVSSDFTHYGKNFDYVPFTKNILLNINQLDSSVLQPIQHQDRADFETVINATHDTMCGFHPERVLLELIAQNAFGPVITRLVAHGTSYDTTHDTTSIVSYASLIITNELDNDILNKQEQDSLLTYARNTLQEAFKPTVNPDLLKPILTLLLEKPQGAFTTLWTLSKGAERQLRGCIGQVHADRPLYEIVAEKVLDSAFHDSRFSPVRASELPNLEIEISVLKEPKPIASYQDIILHKHGIILTNKKRSALFLPTVPAEFGFDLSKTLEELSRKAGLPKDAWKLPTTTFQVFEAQNFEETK